MEKPEYSINEIVEALKNPKLGWNYKNQEDEDSHFGGEVFEIISWNKKPTDIEVLGSISNYKFSSRDGENEATISTSIEDQTAVAVLCTDGAVIILKHPISTSNNKKIEGYWYSENQPQYPMPLKNQLSEQDAKEIFDLIKIKEKESEFIDSRGLSPSRIDSNMVGSGEYNHEKWLWPEGFAEHYVLKYRVKPSDNFLKFIGWK